MFRKKLHVDMKFLHVKVNMGFFSEHVGKKSHVNMEHLFLMFPMSTTVSFIAEDLVPPDYRMKTS